MNHGFNISKPTLLFVEEYESTLSRRGIKKCSVEVSKQVLTSSTTLRRQGGSVVPVVSAGTLVRPSRVEK